MDCAFRVKSKKELLFALDHEDFLLFFFPKSFIILHLST